MTLSVWKYELEVTDDQDITAPVGWKPLSVQTQAGKLCLWALVDPTAKKMSYNVQIWGTGHAHETETMTGLVYVGTAQMADGRLVWHVFAEV